MSHKAETLARANALAALNWVKHTPHHWSIEAGYRKANYWPSTQKFRWSGRRGPRATLTGVTIEKAEAMVREAMPKPLDRELPYWVCTASYCYNGGPWCFRRDCARERL